MYRCEARSREAFIQQVAVSYVLNGYFFYVVGRIPEGKAADLVDAKLIDCYKLDCSKWMRARRKKKGLAKVQYLRFRKTFVLMATEGDDKFFEREGRIQDLREHPLRCFGYQIKCYRRSSGRSHPSVAIAPKRWRTLRRWFRDHAVRLNQEELAEKFRALPFAPFAAVQRQCLGLVRMVNSKRKRAGLALIDPICVRNRRKSLRVFESRTDAKRPKRGLAKHKGEAKISPV